MNKERMLVVADAIEKEEIAKFDMSHFVEEHDCGTSACIGGFAILLFPQFDVEDMCSLYRATEIFELTENEGYMLFLDSMELFSERTQATEWLRDLAEGRKTFDDLREAIYEDSYKKRKNLA